MTRLPIFKMVLAVIVVGLIQSVVLLQFNWFGQEASTAAKPIDTMMDVTIVLSSFIFAIVCVALGYALYKWRAKPGDESDGLPIHGNTKLEVIWTLIPVMIVLGLGGYSWAVLNDIEKTKADAIHVNAYAQQFAWTFGYPESGNKWSEGEIHVPVDRQIIFDLRAQDVIHSFWVPEWRMKKDAVPGLETDVVVTPNREGTFQLVCAELCGLGHTTMRAKVVVESQAEYDKWVAGLKSEVPEDLLLTPDQYIEKQKQLEEQSSGIEDSGVIETNKPNEQD
ncbi:MAG: cytochrome c oxidase subunit II [Solirubrobacterales bacterium]|nr:cytochrome c oxidase subunit II [Solirubrobacterales bacterium]HMT04187.1 cytochrome c oxidase subunit II [Solirubrobacterales bacterium]